MRVTLATHNFSASNLKPQGRDLCFEFTRSKFLSWKWKSTHGIFTSSPDKVYASRLRDSSVFRFHINALDDFKHFLFDHHVNEQDVEWCILPVYEPMPAVFQVREKWVARDYQLPYVEYMASDEPRAKLLEFQTGKGKGLTSMLAVARRGHRLVGIIKPKYMVKWVRELREVYEGFNDSGIVVVGGSKELRALLHAQEEGTLSEAIILISSPTLRNWINEYEEFGDRFMREDKGYACSPPELFEHLRAGVRLIDEGHEDYHFFFKLDTYTHVPLSMTLTATLVNRDPFINKMYKVQYPEAQRMKKLALHRYVDSINVLYWLKEPDKVRTTEFGSMTYSHSAYEKSIIRHFPTLRNYFNLVKTVLDFGYIEGYKPGEKAIIFAYSVDMCTKLTKFLQDTYPHLDVRRYVEDDPYDNVIVADIRVTTIGSGGTALDIPDLAVALMTTAIDSLQANIQALGRLRERPGEKTSFYFLTAENMPKHMKYAAAKKKLLEERAKTYREIPSGCHV